MELFGKNLRIIRIEKEKSQEQLAEYAGIYQVQIARIESGITYPQVR